MVLLIEIRDGTKPKEINLNTQVDLIGFESIEEAIIYAEPHHMENESFVVLKPTGFFGVVPKAESSVLPEHRDEWKDELLAKSLFQRFEAISN
ncbi:MAG: hypothetical protein AAF718_13435 [Pseudomonadota bacterium]